MNLKLIYYVIFNVPIVPVSCIFAYYAIVLTRVVPNVSDKLEAPSASLEQCTLLPILVSLCFFQAALSLSDRLSYITDQKRFAAFFE